MIKLHPNEIVERSVRRHWYVFATGTVSLGLTALLPTITYIILLAIGYVELNSVTLGFFLFFSSAWIFVIWMIFSVLYTNYFLDVWIITNMRIIDIEQHGLFIRETSEYRLDRIQDITVRVGGVLGTYFHFGDIDIQTAGESSDKFTIRNAARPNEVKDTIVQLQNGLINASHQGGLVENPSQYAAPAPTSPQPVNPYTKATQFSPAETQVAPTNYTSTSDPTAIRNAGAAPDDQPLTSSTVSSSNPEDVNRVGESSSL